MIERLEEIRENIFRYLEARIELFTLETRGKVEEGIVTAVHGLVMALLSMMTLIFLFSLLAAYLNEVFESRYLGFLIVASFFLLLTLIWVIAKGFVLGKIRAVAYSILKKNQERKAHEKSEAVQALISQSRSTLNENSRELAN